MAAVSFDVSRITIDPGEGLLRSQKKFQQGLKGMGGSAVFNPGAPAAHIDNKRDVRLLDPWFTGDPEKRPVGVSPPTVCYRLLKNDATLNYYWRKYSFCDLRYPHLPWQVYGWCKEKYINNVVRYTFKLIPRRHGKTYDDCGKGIAMLIRMGVERNNPVMAYYCPVKGQALMNAWNALVFLSRNIPGVRHDQRSGKITWPSPLLENPKSVTTIYFLGGLGGSKTKVGGYYDICVMDEIELYPLAFIQDVGMASTFDRDGYFVGSATPYNLGIIDHFIDEAVKRMRLREAIDKGAKIDPRKVPADLDEWHAVTGDCWTLGVYDRVKLEKFRATLGEEKFAQNFECRNPESVKLFYYRDRVREAETAGLITTEELFDPQVPLRVYYDFGIGQKTDRMAWSVWQFNDVRPVCLAGKVVVGKNYADIVADFKASRYGGLKIFEHCIPHDAGAKEQSDGVEKKKKFSDQLRRQGVNGWWRVSSLDRHQNPTMKVGEVNEILKTAMFHEVEAAGIIECLKGHKRVFNKEHEVVEDRPSKTKYRDGADVVRYALIDWKDGGWHQRMDMYEDVHKDSDGYNPDAHPMEGSILHVEPVERGTERVLHGSDEEWYR